MTLSKEQIEDIQARAAVVSDKPWTVATPEDAAFIEAIAFPTIPALCQQALRAIELEAMFQFEGDDAAHMKPNDPALKDGIVVRRDHFDEMLKRQHSLQSELTATRKALEKERVNTAAFLAANKKECGIEGDFDLTKAIAVLRTLPSPRVKP